MISYFSLFRLAFVCSLKQMIIIVLVLRLVEQLNSSHGEFGRSFHPSYLYQVVRVQQNCPLVTHPETDKVLAVVLESENMYGAFFKSNQIAIM